MPPMKNSAPEIVARAAPANKKHIYAFYKQLAVLELQAVFAFESKRCISFFRFPFSG